jgi:hypothetical protein
VLPKLPPRRPNQELLTEADQLEGAFRQIIQRRIEAGWEIDSETVERDYDYEVYVIPSPERRTDPKNWVHKPVPTTKPRNIGE